MPFDEKYKNYHISLRFSEAVFITNTLRVAKVVDNFRRDNNGVSRYNLCSLIIGLTSLKLYPSSLVRFPGCGKLFN